MPLWKTESGVDKMRIPPKQWTWIKFADDRFFPLPDNDWSIMETILRVEYPGYPACPRTLRGRFVRFPGTAKEDETGHNDVNPIPSLTRHHHWQHFLVGQRELTIGFRVWHDGSAPITIDGRQFKTIPVAPR